MSMAAEATKLLEQRAALIQQMRDLTVKAESEERDLSGEEAQEYDRMEADAEALEKRARRLEKLAGLEPKPQRQIVDNGGEQHPKLEEERAVPESFKEFNEQRAGTKPQDTPEYRQAFFKWMTTRDLRELDGAEMRVLSKATAGAGLNLVPTAFQKTLIDALREYGVMRQISTVITTSNGEDLQVPTVTSHGVATWTAENAAFTASDDAFGRSTLKAYKAATIMIVSEELLADSAFDLDMYVREQFGLRIGVLENTGYLVGDGSAKPTGVATQATAGIVAASATAITADELIDLYYSLLQPYRSRASWLMKDATVKMVRKLKDTTNQYLWAPGMIAGQPDTLFGRPLYTDPDMAAATAGLISVLFGDFSYYWIRDVDGIAFQRLNELYAATGQVGFRAYHRTDGFLMNTAAVKKLTML